MQNRTVLIVDDEPHIAAVIASKLRRVGLTVLTSNDGEDALRRMNATPVDLLIADLRMPGLDGMALCQRMSEEHATASIPVILITGLGHTLDAGELKTPQVRAVLGKPFSPRELTALVQRVLGETSGDASVSRDAA